jgi:hypothetical protein
MEKNPKASRLSAMERQRRELDERIQALRKKELLALPGQFGFDSVDALVFALLEHASPSLREQFRTTGLAGDKGGRGPGVAGNPRIKFSPELRERIRKELEAGLKSVAEISREYGPSHPTIMGWKREWGMTKPRTARSNGSGNSR